MPFPLLPTYRAETLTEVTPEFLKAQDIRLLMLDFDNTIVPYTTSTPTKEMALWLNSMVRSDIPICVVSNSRKDRVRHFCQQYGIPCITHAKKPFHRGIKQCLAQFEISKNQAALVGDQIFTDTLGAGTAGIRCVLVRPINNHNLPLKARHILEKPFIFAARKRRISHEKS